MASHVLERIPSRKFCSHYCRGIPLSCREKFNIKNSELIRRGYNKKMPKSPIYSALVRKINTVFQNPLLLNTTYQVKTLTLKHSEPEPALAIVDFRDDFFAEAHLSYAHLVIEISLTTLALDRDKADIYASANIPEYWIFNLQNRTLEVFQNPENDKYQLTTILLLLILFILSFNLNSFLDLKEFLKVF